MTRIDRYLVRTFSVYLVSVFASVLGIYLVADFVDRAKAYVGPNWFADVAELYGYKALAIGHQLAPAAVLLAAGATVSTLRKRGELTALRSAGFGPLRICAPLALCALVCFGALVAFDEVVVTHASRRVDEIATYRFKRWGDFATFFAPRKWFRRGSWIFYLRGGNAQEGFADVTLLELSDRFELARRVDAARMKHDGDTRWKLTDVSERRFSPERPGRPPESPTAQHAELMLDLGAPDAAFRIRPGRPEQLRLPLLVEQIGIRQEAGLTVVLHVLALHNRFSYPLTAVPACLLAALLALRAGRKGHLTAALVEGLGVSVVFWGFIVVCRALALSGHLSAPVASWTPLGVLSVAAALGLRAQELGGRGFISWLRAARAT